MNKNVGTVDKALRVIAGLAILSLLFILEGNARWWGLIGLGPIATAAMGFCPPYKLLGINTARKKETDA